MIYSKIVGSGCYVPSNRVANSDFLESEFYDINGNRLVKKNEDIIAQFNNITTIDERRKVDDDMVASDMAYHAAVDALESSNFNKEELDYIIIAHNFGDIRIDNKRSDLVPSLASRVKFKLGIENPNTIAYDIAFGCPGWLQGVIQANYYIKSGDAKNIMVIGTDTLSRISDPNDIDSMIYADGAGATILSAVTSDEPTGILAHRMRSDTLHYSKMLFMGLSYKAGVASNSELYLKMNGRRLYQYALENVPQAIKECLEKANLDISDVNKILIHQANGKMDDAITKRLYNLYNIDVVPIDIMPMTISMLGNSSVATVPTLLDYILKSKLKPHQINSGDILIFASVGAGMNINAFVYKA